MPTFVSLLRGVNVAGHRRVKMSDLAGVYSSLGYSDPRTYVQSGNVIFSHNTGDVARIAKSIEKALETRLGLGVTVFIRSAGELSELIAGNPFFRSDPAKLYVTFLDSKPSRVPMEKLNSVKSEGEALSIDDKEVYLYLQHGYGRTKLSNAFFEKVLNVPATTRNWNTVKALWEMTKEDSSGPSQ